ncbi:hypothetical protein FHU41_001018 [Psychromicrobium silvestre]|uniref:DUF2550 domain-containing protein n=1 Tax=Psychromicrobium silvestre TaxID=1645614 RepID=A0A7Y9LSI1_9MICC|nr:DUF2550 domain-containing protein [Psychromicrobium silvestre]NYE94797.1 hypothetical protein [Psychromicrobium silvestre]
MNDLGGPFFIIGLLFLLVILSLCLFGIRRFQLRRALGTVDASICLADNRWRMGVCRYQDKDLEWFRLLSLSPRPRYTFRRSGLEVLGRRAPSELERPLVQPESVIVMLRCQEQEFKMAMKFDAYAGLSSWLEAGPVVGVGTWR